MNRILILVLAALALYWLLRRALGSRKSDGGTPRNSAETRSASSEAGATAPDLVPCAVCGVLVPKDEALTDASTADAEIAPSPERRFYCGEDHRRQEAA